MTLKSYLHKRDFSKTPEPKGEEHPHTTKRLRFVVQKHDASHLHYDFRLEMDGVLKSWAVPRGPSYQTSEKRLAVAVEDHPLEYGHFEGTIPEGQYGGGTVMLWDQGIWIPDSNPLHDYKDGKLVFTLQGQKLKGRWALVRMAGRDNNQKSNWLLIKKHDEYADTLTDAALLNTNSVKTGRSLQEIARH